MFSGIRWFSITSLEISTIYLFGMSLRCIFIYRQIRCRCGFPWPFLKFTRVPIRSFFVFWTHRRGSAAMCRVVFFSCFLLASYRKPSGFLQWSMDNSSKKHGLAQKLGKPDLVIPSFPIQKVDQINSFQCFKFVPKKVTPSAGHNNRKFDYHMLAHNILSTAHTA